MKGILHVLLFLVSFSTCAQKGFVQVAGRQFTLDGKPYRYIGANYWYGGLLATQGEEGRKRLHKELDFMKKQGVTNLRVMVGAEGAFGDYKFRVPQPLQPQQGVFNDSLLVGLDYLLREMGRRDMKAVLHFTNTWDWSGGLGEYLVWNGYGQGPLPRNPDWNWNKFQAYISQFYTCEPCQTAVDNYIRHVMGRTNSLTGVPYVREPAIMSWQIINEPRSMMPASVPDFEKWMGRTAALIKSLDAQHLLSTGSEGEMADRNLPLYERLHTDPNIDYLTIHLWPKNWGWFKDTAIAANFNQITTNTAAYITLHGALAQRLNKPLVLEEFGLPRDRQQFIAGTPTHWRDTFYKQVFEQIARPAQPAAPLAGVNFWSFGGRARPKPGQVYWQLGDQYMGDPGPEEQGLNSVFDADKSTWKIIRKAAKSLY